MTEQEWLACSDPAPMLEFLRGKTSNRKLRLFASGCARRVWHILEDRSRKVVEVSENFADGLADQTVLEVALERVRQYREAIPSFEEPSYLHFLGEVDNIGYWRCRRPLEESAAEFALGFGPLLEAESLARKAVEVAAGLARADAWETGLLVEEEKDINFRGRNAQGDSAFQSIQAKEMHGQADLLRDIFGNPFRPVTADTSWLSPKMSKLAQTIYSRRRFQATPELADALEDAGCTIREMLDHCRGPGPHVRGCWVIDLVLGKS